MPYPSISGIQVAKDLTNNTSLITSPAWYTGDFRFVTVSVSTQSNNATNIQQSNADGFQSPIPENSWANVLAVSVQSLFLLTSPARWSRSSSPSLSSGTIIFVGHT